jgi:hypothetical protein
VPHAVEVVRGVGEWLVVVGCVVVTVVAFDVVVVGACVVVAAFVVVFDVVAFVVAFDVVVGWNLLVVDVVGHIAWLHGRPG